MTEQNIALVSDAAGVAAQAASVPAPGPHDLVVEVRAVSINPVDVKRRAALAAGAGRVLGFDAAGVVTAIGEAVTLFEVGDEVFYAGSIARPGTNQRFHAVDERIVGRKPVSLDFAEAASLPLTALTAWESLFDRLGLTERSQGSLLVVGASGGVGSVLLQLLRELAPGVRAIATASTDAARDWVRRFGADATVDHHGDLAAQLLELEPGGVDGVFTAHSADQAESYARIVKPYGHIVAIDDGPRDIAPLKAKSIAWHWELMFTASVQAPESTRQHEILDALAELVDAGRIAPTVAEVLRPISAETLEAAHTKVRSGRVVGKIVLADWA